MDKTEFLLVSFSSFYFTFSISHLDNILVTRPGGVVEGGVAAGVLDTGVIPLAQELHHPVPLAVPGRRPDAPLKLHLVQRLQSRAGALGRVIATF